MSLNSIQSQIYLELLMLKFISNSFQHSLSVFLWFLLWFVSQIFIHLMVGSQYSDVKGVEPLRGGVRVRRD